MDNISFVAEFQGKKWEIPFEFLFLSNSKIELAERRSIDILQLVYSDIIDIPNHLELNVEDVFNGNKALIKNELSSLVKSEMKQRNQVVSQKLIRSLQYEVMAKGNEVDISIISNKNYMLQYAFGDNFVDTGDALKKIIPVAVLYKWLKEKGIQRANGWSDAKTKSVAYLIREAKLRGSTKSGSRVVRDLKSGAVKEELPFDTFGQSIKTVLDKINAKGLIGIIWEDNK